MLVGSPPPPVTEDRLFQAVTILGFAIVGAQIFGIWSTTTRLRRWHRRPESRPSGALALAWHVILPLTVNLGWAGVVLVGIPLLFGMPLSETVFILGDFAYLIAG